MNILITGATGFIGKHLIDQLIQDHNIFVVVKELSEKNFRDAVQTFLFEDSIYKLSEWVKENKINGVIHLASLFIAQHKNDEIKSLIESNVFFGTALLEALKESSIKWFINTGTIWQNSKHDSTCYSPVNLYAATKQAFISIADFYTKENSYQFVTLKLCDTYGKNDTRKKIFNLFKQVSQTGKTLSMSPGDQLMDILYIDDVVNGFLTLISLLENGKVFEKEYVLSSGKRYSLKQLAAIFSEVTGKSLSLQWGALPYRPNEVMIPWEKGIVVPEWSPKIDLYQGIQLFMKEN
jgi:CDP-paratose synthetase